MAAAPPLCACVPNSDPSLPTNLDIKSGAEAHACLRQAKRGRQALHRLRALLRGFEHREVPPSRKSAAVYHRFRFMAPGPFKKEQAASHEPGLTPNPNPNIGAEYYSSPRDGRYMNSHKEAQKAQKTPSFCAVCAFLRLITSVRLGVPRAKGVSMRFGALVSADREAG